MANIDRLTPILSDDIVIGLNRKWNNAYSFLNQTFASSTSVGQNNIESILQTQFGIDFAYWMDHFTLFFLLVQSSDKTIYVSDGSSILYLNKYNIIGLLKHKWTQEISQSTAIYSSISFDNDNFTFTFNTTDSNSSDNFQVDRYILKTILSNYLETYFSFIEILPDQYPITRMLYSYDYDSIKYRFNTVYETSF